MASIRFEASNEVPVTHIVTLVLVEGSDFPPCSQVQISIQHRQMVLGHGSASVKADGSFTWSNSVSPQRPCDTELTAIVHDSVGVIAEATANVFCP
jgi:hypothetical protein